MLRNVQFGGRFTNIPVSLEDEEGTLSPLDIAQIHIRAFNTDKKGGIMAVNPEFIRGYIEGDTSALNTRLTPNNRDFFVRSNPEIFGTPTGVIITKDKDGDMDDQVLAFLRHKKVRHFSYRA